MGVVCMPWWCVQIKHMAPQKYSVVKKRERTVSRAYGGSRCANCVKER